MTTKTKKAPSKPEPVRMESNSELIQRELETICKRNGGMLPAKAVVDFARNPKTALHKRFDWDDGVAAEKWRIQQARVLIATITIEPQEDVITRAWCSLPLDRVGDTPAYRPTVAVLSESDLREQYLQSVKDELGVLRRKHAALTELASVWAIIDQSVAV